ncbi:MAG TPA: hypothetical protein DCR93_18600, partial [Cytophagales bacterium]|nr:hypothetical protein [Cytophagales bacterium]
MQCSAPVEPPALVPGVSLEIAEDRKARLTGVRYQLHFAIPEEKDAPIDAEVEITFRLAET